MEYIKQFFQTDTHHIIHKKVTEWRGNYAFEGFPKTGHKVLYSLSKISFLANTSDDWDTMSNLNFFIIQVAIFSCNLAQVYV